MTHLKITGVEELRDAIKLWGKVDNLRDVVKKNGAQMQTHSQRIAPVDTGFLRQNIKLYIEDNGLVARMKSEAHYAVYQEYGTRFMDFSPHVRPAYYRQRDKFIRDIENLLKQKK